LFKHQVPHITLFYRLKGTTPKSYNHFPALGFIYQIPYAPWANTPVNFPVEEDNNQDSNPGGRKNSLVVNLKNSGGVPTCGTCGWFEPSF
jgi:hypothetical protein